MGNPRLVGLLLWLGLGAALGTRADPAGGDPGRANLALKRPATQSSTYGGSGLAQSADLGVDGVIAPELDPRHLFHTQLEDNPWWQVDLGGVVAVGEVHLHNRVVAAAPEVQARARRIELLLSSDGQAWKTAYRHDGTLFEVLRLPLTGEQARYVRVRLAERGYLHLYEVEVYGPAPATHPPAAPSAPEEVLTTATIGPAGGQVTAPGHLTVTIPAGALERAEVITLARNPWAGGGAYYQVHREGDGPLREPAEVRLNVPAGLAPAELVMVHQIDGGWAQIVPAQYDPATRTISTTALSFSGFGADTLGKYFGEHQLAAKAAAVGFVVVVVAWAGPAIMGAWLGSAALQSLAAGIGLVQALQVAVLAAGPAYLYEGVAERRDLDRVLVVRPDPANPSARFLLRWDSRAGQVVTRDVATALADPQGRVPFWAAGVVQDDQWRALRERLVRTVASVTEPLPEQYRLENGRFVADLTPVRVPRPVLQAAAELCLSRAVLQAHKLPVPNEVEVLFKPIPTGESGLWAAPFLWVDPSQLILRGSSDAALRTRRAVLLHEYYHACCHIGKLTNNTYPWLEEAIATSLEDEFVGCQDYLARGGGFPWEVCGPVIGSGLVSPRSGRPDESDAGRRGYRLWPWARWLRHSLGWEALWQAADDNLPPATVAEQFELFALALLTSDRGLADPQTVPRPWGGEATVGTGWSPRRIDDLTAAFGLPLGRLALPEHLAAPRPLSLNVVTVAVEASEGTDGPLVVRRDPACADEAYWMLPREAATAPQPVAGMRRAKGLLVVPATHFNQSANWPLALVNSSAAENPASPLLCYRLNPPRSLVFTPAEGGQPANLAWAPPDLGNITKPGEVVAGYRVYLRKAGGEPIMLPEVVTGHSRQLAAKDLAGVDEVGVASEDAVATDGPDRRPLRSPIAWVGVAGGRPGGYLYIGCQLKGTYLSHDHDPELTQTNTAYLEFLTYEVVPIQVAGDRFFGRHQHRVEGGNQAYDLTYTVDGRFNADRSMIVEVTAVYASVYTNGANVDTWRKSITCTAVPRTTAGAGRSMYRSNEPKLTRWELTGVHRNTPPSGVVRTREWDTFTPTGGNYVALEFRDQPWPISQPLLN